MRGEVGKMLRSPMVLIVGLVMLVAHRLTRSLLVASLAGGLGWGALLVLTRGTAGTGGLAMLGMDQLGWPDRAVLGATTVIVVTIRLVAIRYAVHESQAG